MYPITKKLLAVNSPGKVELVGVWSRGADGLVKRRFGRGAHWRSVLLFTASLFIVLTDGWQQVLRRHDIEVLILADHLEHNVKLFRLFSHKNSLELYHYLWPFSLNILSVVDLGTLIQKILCDNKLN